MNLLRRRPRVDSNGTLTISSMISFFSKFEVPMVYFLSERKMSSVVSDCLHRLFDIDRRIGLRLEPVMMEVDDAELLLSLKNSFYKEMSSSFKWGIMKIYLSFRLSFMRKFKQEHVHRLFEHDALLFEMAYRDVSVYRLPHIRKAFTILYHLSDDDVSSMPIEQFDELVFNYEKHIDRLRDSLGDTVATIATNYRNYNWWVGSMNLERLYDKIFIRRCSMSKKTTEVKISEKEKTNYKIEVYPFGVRSAIDLTTLKDKDPEKYNAVIALNKELMGSGIVENLGEGKPLAGNIGYTGMVVGSKAKFKATATAARKASGLNAAIKFV